MTQPTFSSYIRREREALYLVFEGAIDVATAAEAQTALQRFATEYGESAINATTKYVVARIRDEDPSFRPCACSGLQRRALHALVSPVSAYRFDDGRMQFSVARIAGTATSGAVSGSTWKPGGQNAGTVLGHVGLDLLSAAGVDLLREFVFHHRKPE